MNIDDRIKQALANEPDELGLGASSKRGIFAMVGDAYRGGLGRWMWISTVLLFVGLGLLVWTGIGFFTATTLDDRVFWGFCLLLIAVFHIALKQWTWLEMNRNSLIREIKRLEVAVEQLQR